MSCRTVNQNFYVARQPDKLPVQVQIKYLFVVLAFSAFQCLAVDNFDNIELVDLSLEELANLDISSASRKISPLSKTPVSMYVITASDIRRSGANSLQEALRLAPNLQVARIDNGDYAISARGFNDAFSNKLQVLIDGRILYTPLYSGVFWDSLDLLLENIERIEVISGPAASQWGANAVNGVINVVTRSSRDMQGSQLSASIGNMQKHISASYGGNFSDDGTYQIYSKIISKLDNQRENGSNQQDDWQSQQIGFRLDWGNAKSQWQFQGDAYNDNKDRPASEDLKMQGVNLLLEWHTQLESGANLELNIYHDYSRRFYPDGLSERRQTSKAELLYNLPALGSHKIQWGLDYRYSQDWTEPGQGLVFLPAKTYLNWASIFIQDEMQLLDSVSLSLNARAEHNDYTGTEWMPSIRLAWQLADNHLLWAETSRAIRSPSRFDRDLYIPGQPPYFLHGGPNFRSEIAQVYQTGYRALFGKSLSWSITFYRSEYDYLRTLELSKSLVIEIGNGMEGSTAGIETWGAYQVNDHWRLSAGWITMRDDFKLKDTGSLLNAGASQGNSPSYQWQFRSQLDLDRDKELDFILRRVGALPEPEVPAYTVVDFRFGWQVNTQLELSVAALNLLDKRHVEFGAGTERSQFGRSANLSLRWTFL